MILSGPVFVAGHEGYSLTNGGSRAIDFVYNLTTDLVLLSICLTVGCALHLLANVDERLESLVAIRSGSPA